MQALTREDLLSLEDYLIQREDFRRRVMRYKRNRHLALGPNLTLYFEDRLTIQYQIQEMLRVERIFTAAGIQEELDTYNSLIPDGGNLKATLMIEFIDEVERRRQLQRLVGIEDGVWIAAAGAANQRTYAIADEDLERHTDGKTSAVHFLRFELPPELQTLLREKGGLAIGVDHEHYHHEVSPLPGELVESLRQDLA